MWQGQQQRQSGS
ncbi:hypothetical protein DY218_24115 [Streptomyces triticagri]|uniref:Uncharacterized protein n=1 Tax=Streptomyces triticagri TaxID=2293568 RepID=A0A372LZV9_9ACTN|nr:hypothetical protein DY218_24115 [Streptomyces triticagri]